MAKKFWEKLSNSRIQFYDEPLDLRIEDADARIAELQAILALSDQIKGLLVQTNPAITTIQEFDAIWDDELMQLADQRDYFDNSNVTITEEIEVVDHRWMEMPDMSLAPGTVYSVCGEEVSNPASQAIDGMNGTNWQHDVDEVHEIVLDLGYKKRIDGIRISNPSSPGNPFLLSGVQVYIASGPGGLDDESNHVGVDLEFTDPDDNDRDLETKTGRYVRIVIGSTGHGSNHISLREISLRTRPRTFGL